MPEVKEGGEFWFGKNGPPVLEGFRILTDLVVNNQNNPGYMIRFANQLKKRRYIHPREFFEYLSKHELEELLEKSNEALIYLKKSQSDYDKFRASASVIFSCTALLLKAEGESTVPLHLMETYCANFMSLLAIHKFGYLGVVKPKYENFTVFGTDRELFDKKDDDSGAKETKETPPET